MLFILAEKPHNVAYTLSGTKLNIESYHRGLHEGNGCHQGVEDVIIGCHTKYVIRGCNQWTSSRSSLDMGGRSIIRGCIWIWEEGASSGDVSGYGRKEHHQGMYQGIL
ncbi:hypothetical protein Tco_1474537 [Tanacetum coccineum]